MSLHVLSTYHEHQKEIGQMEGKRGERISKSISHKRNKRIETTFISISFMIGKHTDKFSCKKAKAKTVIWHYSISTGYANLPTTLNKL